MAEKNTDNCTQRAVAGKRALRPREVRAAYGIGKTKVYELIREGRIRSVKVGSARLIPVDELEALVAGER